MKSQKGTTRVYRFLKLLFLVKNMVINTQLQYAVSHSMYKISRIFFLYLLVLVIQSFGIEGLINYLRPIKQGMNTNKTKKYIIFHVYVSHSSKFLRTATSCRISRESSTSKVHFNRSSGTDCDNGLSKSSKKKIQRLKFTWQ